MRSTKIIKICSSSLCTCLHHMVILGTRNKITDFFMILAWASPFKHWKCNMQKCVIRTTVGDPRKKNWQIVIFNNHVMSGIFQFLETCELFWTVSISIKWCCVSFFVNYINHGEQRFFQFEIIIVMSWLPCSYTIIILLNSSVRRSSLDVRFSSRRSPHFKG